MSPKPRIVGHNPPEVADSPPPRCGLGHPWSLAECQPAKGKPIALYLDSKAEDDIRKHALRHAPERLEVMGLLVGEVRRHKGVEFSVAKAAITTELEASGVGVRFSRGGLNELAAALSRVGFDYVVVGWYHSHPGFGCFLSDTDVETQRQMFSGSAHVALVVDPVKEEAAAFKLSPSGYEPVRFCVYVG
jgi:proteasome lid subunit RPN8/RPN11